MSFASGQCLKLFLLLSQFTACSYALAFPSPAKTPPARYGASGLLRSTPTTPADPEVYGFEIVSGILQKRAGPPIRTDAHVAPDSVCGYVGGESASDSLRAYACPKNYTCGVTNLRGRTSSLTDNVVFCFTVAKPIPSIVAMKSRTCFDSSQYKNGVCGADCETDPEYMKCTDSSMPYCKPYVFTEWGAYVWECASKSFDAPFDSITPIQTTYDGQSQPSPWKNMVFEDVLPPTAFVDDPIYFTGTETYTASATSGAAQKSTATGSKSPPVGAIIGGVMGGLALLIGGACGITWIIMRERRRMQRELEILPELPPGQVLSSELPPSISSPRFNSELGASPRADSELEAPGSVRNTYDTSTGVAQVEH